MQQAEEIEQFLNAEGTSKSGKATNRDLYAWIKRETRGLYGQCFQLAFEMARKAERAFQHELGRPDLGYVQPGYLSGKEGFLAGEKLLLDIKRMEAAYLDLNQREYELTKHVSLLQLDPMALLQLRATGRCIVSLPEELFDMDGPGHYFRRIRSVAVSIPCVTGPHASIGCTLTLLKSTLRRTANLTVDGYARTEANDLRFEDRFSSLRSVVTSSALNDAGLFESQLRDERFLPFELFGVVSEWQLQLPANPSCDEPTQFDYATISDVILHMSYTAREGGEVLRKGAMRNLGTVIAGARAPGSVRLFSVRHEFPNEWARFEAADGPQRELKLKLHARHFPYWSQGRSNRLEKIEVLAGTSEELKVGYKGMKGMAPGGEAPLHVQLRGDVALGGRIVRAPLTDVGLRQEDERLADKPTGVLELTLGPKPVPKSVARRDMGRRRADLRPRTRKRRFLSR